MLNLLDITVPLPVSTSGKPKAAPAAQPAGKPSAPLPSLKPTDGYTDVELTGMRKTIAKRLTESKVDLIMF